MHMHAGSQAAMCDIKRLEIIIEADLCSHKPRAVSVPTREIRPQKSDGRLFLAANKTRTKRE